MYVNRVGGLVFTRGLLCLQPVSPPANSLAEEGAGKGCAKHVHTRKHPHKSKALCYNLRLRSSDLQSPGIGWEFPTIGDPSIVP